MTIDPKDLIAMKEFRPGGYFYQAQGNGKFSLMNYTPEEMKPPGVAHLVHAWVAQLIHDKKVFLNRNKPWHAMNGFPPAWARNEIKVQ